nr:non-ribosomal peptide synthetase [Rhodococcus sp. B50]
MSEALRKVGEQQGDGVKVGDPDDTRPAAAERRRPRRRPERRGARAALLPQLLAAAVERDPSATAVVEDERSLTYAELDEASSRLARYLIGLGIGPEDVVALAIVRSVESVLATWAVAKTGAAFVPVDPNYPADRVEHMTVDSGAALGLTLTRTEAALPVTTRWIALDDPAIEQQLADLPSEPVSFDERVRTLRVENTAYIIYTSGSTGRPKGVVVTHSGLGNFCAEQVERYALTSASRTLHFASPSFDASILELLLAIGASSTMVIAPTSVYGGEEFADLVVRQGVTHAFVTPSALASVDPAGLGVLDCIVVGGEACPPDLVTRWAPGRRFFNGYGPTETTIMTNISDPLVPGEQVTIGAPIRNTTAHVLDSRLHAVPAGVTGELYLSGPGVARGYHRRAELTASRFVAAPGGTRMYRTGDLVRGPRDAESPIVYIGRNDFQVKVRGFRIELGEIDAVLASSPAVDFAATLARTGPSGQAQLIAYVHAAPGATVDSQELSALAAERLPAHMVPSAIVSIDEIPLSPTGKLDRDALPDPGPIVTEFRAPRTGTELAIAAVFADVLGLATEQVGLDDDFFDLGGNSLVATRVAARLSERLGVRVPARLLFEGSTVAALAALVEPLAGDDRIPLVAGPRPETIPLSLAQQRMWFLSRFDTASAANNIPVALRLRGKLDTDALGAAVADLVERHETLRTVYPDHDGVGSQLILPASQATPALRAEVVTEAEVQSRVVRAVTTGFDVTAEVPLRLELLRITRDDASGATGDDEHVLIIVVHHIAADGTSIEPFVRDLVTAYLARANGAAPGWEPLAVHYADYTLWQRAVLGDEDDPDSPVSQEIAYWTSVLADLPDRLDLPTDRPRPVEASGRGATVEFEIDAVLHEAVVELGRAAGCSPFMVVHAAFAILLSRISGANDIAIGTPVAGRGEQVLEDLIGMFVNTLVLRTSVTPERTFADVLREVRASDIDAFAHAELPFERLVEILDPVRSAGHHPLFQVALFFQNMEQPELALPGLEVEPVDLGGSIAKFDLQLTVGPREIEGRPAGMGAQFTYASDLFDESTVQSLATRLVTVLDALTGDVDAVVGDVELLSPPERHALTVEVNATERPIAPQTLLSRYRAQVAATPDVTAVVFGDDSLTYAEFDARVNRLARHLISVGVGPESLVALGIRRSIDLVVAMYAVVAAGGAYVPLDPDHPADRIGHILDTARPVCVLSTGTDAGDLPEGVDIILVDGPDLPEYPAGPVREDELRGTVRGTSPAYVIFTSGSTGRPKGVSVPHEAIVNQLEWMAAEYDISARDVYLQKTATTFDVSLWGYFLPLRTGGTLVVATHDGHRDPAYVAEAIVRYGVTLTDFVPSMLTVFAAHAPAGVRASLRHVFVIGEALPPETVTAFRRLADAAVHNLYGPTEAAVSATYWPAEGGDHSVPIGVPEANVQVYVLDSRLRPTPVGTPGELYLGGVQLARGYEKRPDLTSDRFVASPLGARGSRMYRTGDLVRWRRTDDGALVLDYLGRTDFQVKFRGQRIELGEIETALLGCPEVSQAVALVVPTPTGEQLVAYVVPAPGHSVEKTALLDAVRSVLPSYMVPSAVVVLDAFPLNTSGKLDRKALPEPVFEVREFRAPRTPIEEIVANVYADVLGVDRVGRDDHFFDLGGNSLVATQVAARLGAALGTRVAVRSLFEHPVVESLAAHIESSAAGAAAVPLTARTRPDHVPLSLAQQRMWFLNRFEPDSAVNNLPLVIRLRGSLDLDALRGAVGDVVLRHESLRTVYPETDGIAHQVVLPASSVVPAVELSEVDPGDVLTQVAAILDTGFDVTAEVPLRIRLLRVAADDHVLVVVLHHISGDGFSMGPLARDVMVAYSARTEGLQPNWAPLPVQYADYTLWQREVLGSEDDPDAPISRQLAYWRDALKGIPEQIDLPADRPRPAVASGRGANTAVAIDAQTHAALEHLARDRGASLFMVFHSALAAVLARLSGTEDIVVGAPIAGRGEQLLDDMIGMFVNTLVLRSEVRPSDTFADLLGRVRESDLGAFGHADLPFERLVEVLDPERSQARHPLFQVALTFQNLGRSRFELPGLAVEAFDVPVAHAKFDLQVTVVERFDADGAPGGLDVVLTYAVDLFDEATMRRFGDRLGRMLTAAATNPEAVIGDVSLLDPAERREVLEAWNEPGARAADVTLVDRFREAAEAHPDSVAVTFGDRQLTYAELSARVNRLARELVDRGVRPDTLVGVALPRTEELVVALLAVQQAGGGYLPIDLTYPAERLAFMLADAAPVCVLVAGESGSLPATDVPVIDLDRLDLSTRSADPISDEERVAPPRSDNLAYVIYTSGSTGRPKGVQIPHRTVLELFENTAPAFGFDADDVWTLFHSYAFDFSVWELWGPLLHGGRLVVVDYHTSRSPEDFHALLRRERVTVLNQTPSAFYQLAEADAVVAEQDPDAQPLSLRYVVFGGEALDLRRLAGWYRRHGDSGRAPRLVNMYGITETTVHVSHLELSSADVDNPASTVGRAIPGLGIYVLDARLQPVPVGVPGEIYVRGGQLARGYLGRAELTSGRFVADPYGAPGSRMYRTGDVARWNARGHLEYAGRSDLQVQLRGFRIELGEIEAALTGVEGVAHAVASVWSDENTGEKLVGYVVPRAGHTVAPSEVLERVGEFLTGYMVPDAVLVLDALPLTPNGKLDRRSLPAPVFTSDREFRAPRTPIEQTIAEVFADVLGLEQVGLDDSFFALGGDSIVSIQLVSRAKARGVVFTPREVFEQRTVAGLAEVARAGTGSEPVLRELEGGGVGEIPLTPIVRYMVERGGGFDRYTQTIALELPAGIDRSDVVATVAAVVDRHDMLRATLRDNGSGESVLSTSAPGSIDVDALVTRVEVPADAGDDEWVAIAARELDAAEGRLAPSQGIVTQFVWLDPAAEATRTGRLIVVAHHLVVDGVSWRILVPDFVTAWAQISHGQRPALQPVGTSFRTWAHALVDGASGRTAELPLWSSVLEGPDPLLGDRPFDPSVDLASTVVKVPVRVDAATTETLLTTLPELYHGSVNDVLLTGLALALAEWRRARGTDVRSALIRLEGHGREEDVVPGSDLSRTVGWFTTMFPVRLDLSDVDLDDAAAGGASAGAALKAVKEDLRRVPDKGIGYGLLRYCNPETSARLATTPAGQISFNYLGRLDAGEVSTDRVPELGWLPAGDLGDLSGTDDPDAPALAAVDINAVVLGGELGANFGYASGLLDRADVEDLAQRWVRALEALAAHVTRPEAGGRTPSDLSLVDVTQRDIDLWESRYSGADDAWPLAPLQAGLLYHAHLAEGHSDVYNTQVLVHLAGVVDAQRLRAAAGALLERYPNLRAAFVASESGLPVQVVVDDVVLPWRELDIRSDDPAALAEVLRAEQAVAFDMAEPPLIRFVLVRTGDDGWTLAVTSHHILLDGWSMPLLMKDLLVLYATRGDADVLGRAPSYRAYLEWLARRDHEASVQAWIRSLDGIEEPTLLAGGNTDDTGGTPAEHRIDLGRERSDGLTDTASRLGVTVNTVLQGAWAVLLARTTDRDDVVFGTTVSGRPADLPGVESMVGLFINTLPVRVRLGTTDTGHDLLRRIQGEQAELLDHHHVGLAEIQQRTGTGALFDTLLVYESYPVDRSGIEAAGSIDGLVVAGVNARDATHYPLTVVVTSDDALTLAFKYRSDILDAADVEELATRYVRILDALVAAPESPVDSLPYLDAVEIEDLTDRWGGPALPAVPLGDLLAATAAHNPDGVAVVHAGRSLTYAELDARSSRLARLLVGRGIGTEDVVALGLTRSFDSITAVWAVARAGAAYVPVDPNYPADRVAHMISDSGAVLGLTLSTERDRLPGDVQWIDLTDPSTLAELEALSDEPFAAHERLRPVRAGNVAYVIYTSGSTGLPKGVVVSNSGLANFAAAQREHYGLDTGTRALHFASPSFDASVLELLLAVGGGGTLVIASPGIYGGSDLAELIRSEGVTHAFITSAAVATLDPEGLDGLRVLAAGGEAVPPELVARWAPGRAFHNVYGPTETTIVTTISEPLAPGDPITIGGPIRGVRALVLDKRLRPVPVGVPGELYMSGVQTARGYHRRPGLTAERFVADPFGSGGRLYRTGDVVRWTGDGKIAYVGRSDFQVKVRGFRIELDEIDAVLRREPSVDFAVTVARRYDTGGVRLISYVTATAGHVVDPEDLLRAATRALPQHMVPADLVVLDAVPLTHVGKLDRAALPDPETRTRPYRAPRTGLERVVARVYADALDVEQVGLDDDFFDLGGNSLVATQVVARLRDETGLQVRVPWLLETPAVESLASRLAEAVNGTGTEPVEGGDAGSAVLVTLRPGDATAPVFCFHPMIGLAWPYAPLAARLATSSAVYGVQTPALSEPGFTAASLTDLARRYTDEIVAAAPDSRYRLIGWSLGGVLAHAVAVELQARGLQVEDLALIDSIPRIDTDRFAAELSENLRAFGVSVDTTALDGGLPHEAAESLVRAMPDGLIDLDVERVQGIFAAAVTSPELINAHEPELFSGDMEFFSATEDHPTEADAADLWRPFVSGRVRTRFVPGAHGEMMDPSAIDIIAPALDAATRVVAESGGDRRSR